MAIIIALRYGFDNGLNWSKGGGGDTLSIVMMRWMLHMCSSCIICDLDTYMCSLSRS